MQAALRGAAWGLLIALVVAAVPTALDVYQNPSELFRSAQGMRRDRIGETLWSWLAPAAIATIPMGALLGWGWQAWKSRQR